MKKVLALIVLCFIAFNSHAQLRYQNGYLGTVANIRGLFL